VRTELHRAAPGAVTCVASDITDLAEALAPDAVPDGGRFARIVASVPDGLWEVVVHDAAAGVCEFSFASARLWDILGMEPAEAFRLGDLLAEAVPPEDRPLSRDQFRRLLRREDVSVAEHRIVRPDDPVRWVRWTALGRFGDDGVVRLVGTIRDVTGEIVRPPARAAERIAGLPPLTARQREVLDHLASGASTDEIARAMGIRPVTVANHVAALLRRLGVRSRLEAVAMVLGQATGERWLSGAVPGPGDRDVPGPVG